MKHFVFGAALALSTIGAAWASDTPAPEDAALYIINLEDGATVQSPVQIKFGLQGMGVAPAGVEKEQTGHHHIYLNRPAFGEAENDAEIAANGIPSDDNHIHFGGGQTEVSLDLEPGEYTVQLVLGDHFHIPHNPPVVSERITITVTE
ncbi:DUF4399 domain-containing protein [Marivita sp. S0852]|uniref:DUF4399 domain-containing protein n=1 Tax=Marivita sp. S0852 TaxID=3373893 RepID=UPI003981FAF0